MVSAADLWDSIICLSIRCIEIDQQRINCFSVGIEASPVDPAEGWRKTKIVTFSRAAPIYYARVSPRPGQRKAQNTLIADEKFHDPPVLLAHEEMS